LNRFARALETASEPFSQRLLAERVKAVLRRWGRNEGTVRKVTEAANVMERGQLRVDPERHMCTWKNKPVRFTVTEFLIVQALAARPGVVKSRNALLDAAYMIKSMLMIVQSTVTSSACARNSSKWTTLST
jgi:DNA-binding response OmpR family regulator